MPANKKRNNDLLNVIPSVYIFVTIPPTKVCRYIFVTIPPTIVYIGTFSCLRSVQVSM